MYDSYFGFTRSPFENHPDPEFLFLGKGHHEVLASLLYFVQTGKGFALLCGDVGTGKTMLLNCFLTSLPPSVQAITVSNPFVSALDILKHLAQGLGLAADQENLLALSDRVKEALLEAQKAGRQILLVVDEAHLLSDRSLEGIRVLSNLETSKRKLLQILLVGQHELSHRLNRDEMRPLRQRLNVNRYLTPLSSQETVHYIDHRLKIAWSSFENCFDTRCQGPIFRMTKGVPRRINQLCDNALLICMAEGAAKVDRRILKKAQEAVQTDSLAVPPPPKKMQPKGGWRTLYPWTAVSVLVLVALGALGYRYFSKNYPYAFYGASRLASGSPASLQAGPRISTPEKGRSAPTKESVSASKEVSRPPADPAPVKPPRTPEQAEITGHSPPAGQGGQERPAITQISLPAPEPTPATMPNRVTVQKGDCLTGIASRHYGNSGLGLLALILANRDEISDDLVYSGQNLYLPEIDERHQTVRLQDGSYYASYALISSPGRLKEITSWLKKNQVSFLVIRSRDDRGQPFHRVVIGGYQSQQDLKQAFEKAKTKDSKS